MSHLRNPHPEVDIAKLDYSYVETATDAVELRKVAECLASGYYGGYPDLEAAARKRLLELLPAKEKKTYIMKENAAKKAPIEAVMSAQDDLGGWLSQINADDKELRDADIMSGGTRRSKVVPSVRGAAATRSDAEVGSESGKEEDPDSDDEDDTSRLMSSSIKLPGQTSKKSKAKKAKRVEPKAKPMKQYFEDWSKFDVDDAIAQLDTQDADRAAEVQRRRDAQEAKAAERRRRMLDREATLQHLGELDCLAEGMGSAERAMHANREREKGNECFKAGDYEDAVRFYARSLRLVPRNATVRTNSAMARLKLKQHELADEDCCAALAIEATNIKALCRRGMARTAMGRHLPAIIDFEAALELEPHNAQLRTLRTQAQKDFRAAEGDRADGILEHRRVKALGGVADGAAAMDLADGAPTVAVKFNRLSIEESDGSSDDESSEEEEEEAGAGFNRLVIDDGEDDSSDEDEDDAEDGAAVSFEAASEWQGVRTFGAMPTVFMRGAKGLGYYVDETRCAAAVVTPAAAAAPRAAAVAADAGDESVPEGGATAESWKMRGNRLLMRGDAAGAIDCYTQSLTLKPTQVAAYSNRAQAHLTLENWNAAERDCSVGIGISSMSKDSAATVQKLKLKCFFRRATAYTKQGKLSKALSDVEKILAIEADSARALALKQEITTQLSGAPSSPPPAASSTQAQAAQAQAPPVPPTVHARCLAAKVAGNAALKARKLDDALRAYTEGIVAMERHRGTLMGPLERASSEELLVTLRSNRAQAHLARRSWREAVADCSTALERGTFEGKLQALGFKIQFRRAKAHRLWAAEVAQTAGGAREAGSLLNRASADIRAILTESKRSGNTLSPSALRGAQAEDDALKAARKALAAAATTNTARGKAAAPEIEEIATTATVTATAPKASPKAAAPKAPTSPAAKAKASPKKMASPATSESTLRAGEVARVRARAAAVTSVPKTAFEFEKVWTSLALPTDGAAASDETLAARYEYMQTSVKPARLKKLFARGMEPMLFADIITLLHRHYAGVKPKRTLAHLKALSAMPSFGTARLMMGGAADQAVMEGLFATLRAVLGDTPALVTVQASYGVK